MNATSVSPDRATYLPGVDGLRALAVIAVLLFHGNASWLPGGFLGVEVFFVISGFLITRGLVDEWQQFGRIDLKSFWRRRALRLLPALFLLLATVLTLSAIFEPSNLTKLHGDTLAALSYATNWFLIFDNQSYFESWGRPSLLGHLWSLAIEEQFYLLWPLLLAFAIRIIRLQLLILLILLGALASYAGMALLYGASEAADTSRIYYGTDTRVGALLLGSLLAFMSRSERASSGPLASSFINLLGLSAIAFLVFLAITLDQNHAFLYRGGFIAASLASCILITSLQHPESMISRLMGIGPLRWIGVRSYGIYLWHWPIFLLAWPQSSDLKLFLAQITATIFIASLSYRFLEVPARKGGVGRIWTALGSPQARNVRPLAGGFALVAVAAFVAGLVAIAGQNSAPSSPPILTQAEVRLASPSESLLVTELASNSGTEPALVEESTSFAVLSVFKCSTPENTASGQSPADTWQLGECTPINNSPPPGDFLDDSGVGSILPTVSVPAAPQPFEGPLTAIGDSVMLGAAYALADLIPDIAIDAEVSRAPIAAISRLREIENAGNLAPTVVVHIGNNGPFSQTQFESIIAIVGPDRRVFFLSLKVPRSWEQPNNDMLAAGIAEHSNAFLIDWKAATAEKLGVFWTDDIHLVEAGTTFYAELVAAAISE